MNARLQSLRPFIHRQRNYLKIFSDSISGIRHSQAPAGRFRSLCRYGFFRNIAPSDEPVVSWHRRPLRTRSGFLARAESKVSFVCGKCFPHTKRPGAFAVGLWFAPKSQTLSTIIMAHKKSGRPKAADPKTHRYNFLLNDKQEIRFRKMLEEADCTKNISRFILSRLFG